MTAPRTTIAGIAIPDGALAGEATEFIRDASTQLLFDHSRRAFLWASLRAEQLSLHYDAELQMTDILEATVPGCVRPNICDYIRNSRFKT